MRYVLLLASSLFLLSSISHAQEGKLIKEVVTEGNRAVQSDMITAALKTKPGTTFSFQKIGDDIRYIYSLGAFSNVRVDVEDLEDGVKVIFVVEERPQIKDILFSGNKGIKTSQLKSSISISPGQFLNEEIVAEEVKKIEELYKGKGYHFVGVSYDLLYGSDGKVTVLFKISEGSVVKVGKVEVKGNKALKGKEVLKLIGMKKGANFRESDLEEGMKKLKDRYRDLGFPNAEIDKKVSVDPGSRGADIEISISEGPRSYFGSITFLGNKVLGEDALKEAMAINPGDPFSEERLRKGLMAVQTLYLERGYVEVMVRPSYEVREGPVDVKVEIVEGEVAYIGDIRITGNKVTKEKVIRREILVKPGEPFNLLKVQRSRDAINRLGFFDEVTWRPDYSKYDPKERKIDIEFQVKEGKTGSFQLGAGYGVGEGGKSKAGFLANLQLSKSNLFGLGRSVNANLEVGADRHYFSFDYRAPWFLDTPATFGLSLYDTTLWRKSYKERRIGGNITLGIPLVELIKPYIVYKYEDITISDVDEYASTFIKEQAGRRATSSVALSISRDTRDDIFDPSRGSNFSASVEYAGFPLGGDNDFIRGASELSLYAKAHKMLVVAWRIRGEAIKGLRGKEVPIYERMFLGGPDTLRSYEFRSIPSEEGGLACILTNIELRIPVSREIGVVLFLDMGWAGNGPINPEEIRYSFGAGIRVRTPIAPLRFDLAWPLFRKKGDMVRNFQFSIGQMF
jgi:outer membrane protein insertion porin family